MSMTEAELEDHLETAEEVDTYDYRNPESDDGYFSAVLKKAADGRHFRVVLQSGYDSRCAVAGNVGDWLDDHEVAKWRKY